MNNFSPNTPPAPNGSLDGGSSGLTSLTYRGINPLPAGGVVSAAALHPHYQRRLAGNSSLVNTPPSEFPTETKQADVKPVFDSAALVWQDQQAYFQSTEDLRNNPTRFDVQNDALKIGGAPRRMHRDLLGESHPPAAAPYPITSPHTPQPPLSEPYINPLVFDYGSAVRSTHPRPVTFPSETIERMMRSPDEVDPALVTNPIPDPTFMARQPMFDKSAEDAATQRWRLQQGAGMRFW